MTSTWPVAAAVEAALRRRCAAVVAGWALRDEIVLIGAGEPVSIPGRGGQVYPFRAHSEYFHLTDRDELAVCSRSIRSTAGRISSRT